MTNTFTITAGVDSTMEYDWAQSKLDSFGQFPALIITVDRLPTQNYSFLAEKPLKTPTKLNIYGLTEGQIINITVIKG